MVVKLVASQPSHPFHDHAGGCDSLVTNVTEGLPNVFGARYTLNLTIKPNKGVLMPSGPGIGGQASPVPQQTLQLQVTAGGVAQLASLEVLISMQPQR